MSSILLSLLVAIGWLVHWTFFIVGAIVTGIVVSQLVEERARRAGIARAEKELNKTQ